MQSLLKGVGEATELQAQLDQVKGSLFSKLRSTAHLLPASEMPTESGHSATKRTRLYVLKTPSVPSSAQP